MVETKRKRCLSSCKQRARKIVQSMFSVLFADRRGQIHFGVSFLLMDINYTSLVFIVEGKTALTGEAFLYFSRCEKGCVKTNYAWVILIKN